MTSASFTLSSLLPETSFSITSCNQRPASNDLKQANTSIHILPTRTKFLVSIILAGCYLKWNYEGRGVVAAGMGELAYAHAVLSATKYEV